MRKKNPTLKIVQNRFKAWRKKRNGRESIPEELWFAAIQLTKEMSVNQVSRALGLNHTALSDRVSGNNYRVKKTANKEPRRAASRQSAEQATRFVELDWNGTYPSMGAGCEVELENSKGLKLRLRGGRLNELLDAVRTIWDPGE